MKLSTLWMIMVALQFTLMMFGGSEYQPTALFNFVLNPVNWSTLDLITFIGLTAVGIAGVAIVGSLIFGKTDTLIFAASVGALLSFSIPIGSLWLVISREVGIFGTQNIGGIPINNFIASAFTAPLAILAIATVLNWWRTTAEG